MIAAMLLCCNLRRKKIDYDNLILKNILKFIFDNAYFYFFLFFGAYSIISVTDKDFIEIPKFQL
jgi:hypothetical protein